MRQFHLILPFCRKRIPVPRGWLTGRFWRRDALVRGLLLFFLLAGPSAAACAPKIGSGALSPAPASSVELVVCDYPDDLPQAILEGFHAETGIRVRYQAYSGMDEAIQMLKQSKTCDLITLSNDYILEYSQAGLLAKLNKSNLPNIKNISPNFRDMVYDPQNLYTVPYHWGTTGLVYRSDLVQVTRWSDLWNPEIQGRVGLWREEPRDGIGLELKSLGFSVNSEDPEQVNAAVDRLVALGSRVVFLDDENQSFSADYLNAGKIVIALGWAGDATLGRKLNPAIRYLLPEDGAMLWGDNFIIPASSKNQAAAEKLLNYILRPESTAKIVNYNSYATANQAALQFITPDILNNPVIFPSEEDIRKAEICLPLTVQGEKLYKQAWGRFLAAHPPP